MRGPPPLAEELTEACRSDGSIRLRQLPAPVPAPVSGRAQLSLVYVLTTPTERGFRQRQCRRTRIPILQDLRQANPYGHYAVRYTEARARRFPLSLWRHGPDAGRARRLVEHKGKWPIGPVDRFEGRIRCLNVRQTWPCWNEAKIGQPDGGGGDIVVAAGRVDNRERVPSPLEHPQHTLKLERISDPFDSRFGMSSAYAPIRDRSLGIRLQHAYPLTILHGGDCQADGKRRFSRAAFLAS
jgi:hypothetical protein